MKFYFKKKFLRGSEPYTPSIGATRGAWVGLAHPMFYVSVNNQY
jgi:hypothetical protein